MAQQTTSWRAARCLSVVLAILTTLGSCDEATAERDRVGTVEQVQARATAVYEERTRQLEVESPVHFEDRLETGPEARLRVRLLDDSEITMGAQASLVVDAFIYAPADSAGALTLRVVEGAFLFVSGKMKRIGGSRIELITPLATLGISGTRVWAGRIDGGYGILALDGTVVVSGRGGQVTLQDGEGTTFVDSEAPPETPVRWPSEKVARAFAAVSFEP